MKNNSRLVKKIIKLTITGICAIILFVYCRGGNQYVENEPVIEAGVIDTDYDEVEESKNEDSTLEEVFKYNEAGKIIIVMYHRIVEKETDEWTRSFDNFYEDLKYLYEKGYRSISLNDYINNDIRVPMGCTPIVLTFDDGTKGQFNLIKDDNGNLIANPKSAVGIMEKFHEEHPDFGLNGTFFINQTGYFSGEGTREERLRYLIDRGFEIGNHTSNHVDFSKIGLEEIQKEIGEAVNKVKSLTDGYEMNSIALPYGNSSKEYSEYIQKGEYEGITYHNKAILLVGSNPALSPNNEKLNLLRLPRVRARGYKPVHQDLYYWLEEMEKNPNMKYTRIE